MMSMRRVAGTVALSVALLLGSGLLASLARVGYVVTLQKKVGNDVGATGNGPPAPRWSE